jgi:hypothetical protein
MQRIIIVILVASVLSGCSTLGSLRPLEANMLEVPKLGIVTQTKNYKLVVQEVEKGNSGDSAGVKYGDIIESVDGKVITTPLELLSIIHSKGLGQHVIIVINRYGQQIRLDFVPIVGKLLPTAVKIRELLINNDRVAVAIIVSEVRNSFRNVPSDWAESMKNNAQFTYESGLARAYGNIESFSIVDRLRLKEILDEYKFSQSGLVSDKIRTRIGEMTGATNIIDISYTRYPSSFGKDDVMSARLIDIGTGKILAVDRVVAH